ncbi:hypothetical protein [Thermocrispum agreste]|uniref:Uncharacterized protein n=1 Tax=Thermocrispum agreste TaxID=37925 RepID=A0ABD6FH68_9PSEU|nr:hypothetical protein [Thermocrispum agreste]
MCFDADASGRFATDVRREAGFPVIVGMPGVVEPAKLMRIAPRV